LHLKKIEKSTKKGEIKQNNKTKRLNY